MIADDKALDLEGWVSNSTWEIGYKRRLVDIAYKLKAGIPLEKKTRSIWSGIDAKLKQVFLGMSHFKALLTTNIVEAPIMPASCG